MDRDIYYKIHKIANKMNIKANFYRNRIISPGFFDNNTLQTICLYIVNKCNLNCAYCDNFSPLIKDEWYISQNVFEKNIKRLNELFPNISYLSLGGGESLLHPQLLSLCRITRKYYPNSNIHILTNGILLDNMNTHFYNTLLDLNIGVIISEYPIRMNYLQIVNKYNADKIICTRLMKNKMYNLSLSLTKYKSNSYYNCDYSGISNNKRISKKCIQLDKNGNLFFCGIIANIYLLENYFNIKFEKIKGKDGDYVNIYEIKHSEDIVYGINHKLPFCDYCSEYSPERYVNWKLSEYKLDEWVKIKK